MEGFFVHFDLIYLYTIGVFWIFKFLEYVFVHFALAEPRIRFRIAPGALLTLLTSMRKKSIYSRVTEERSFEAVLRKAVEWRIPFAG